METLHLLFANIGQSVPSLVANTGLFAKTILLLLFVISVISWAIIWDRTRLYLRLRAGGRRLGGTLASKGLSQAIASLESSLPSLEGAVLLETRRYMAAERGGSSPPTALGEEGGSGAPLGLRQLLERRVMEEISEMEKFLVFLATTASVSPFLGLLGTVWGIMSSFLSMGIEGTASIEVVGPGIAEALVTTIAGLGAAIPALVGYNLLVRHVRRQETKVDIFISRVVEEVGEDAYDGSHSRSEAAYEEKPI